MHMRHCLASCIREMFCSVQKQNKLKDIFSGYMCYSLVCIQISIVVFVWAVLKCFFHEWMLLCHVDKVFSFRDLTAMR